MLDFCITRIHVHIYTHIRIIIFDLILFFVPTLILILAFMYQLSSADMVFGGGKDELTRGSLWAQIQV